MILGGIGFVLAILIVQYQILGAGISLSSVMICIAVLLPFIAMAALATRRLWIGVLLGLLTINVEVPIPVLSRITPGLFFVVLVICFELIGTFANQRQYAVFRTVGSRCMMLAAAGIAVRVLWDRPGSTNLGQSGGAGQAIMYLAGGGAYFAVSLVAADRWDTLRNSKIMVFLAAIGVVIGVAISGAGAGMRGAASSVFSLPTWLIASLALAWLHNYWVRGGILAWTRYLFTVFLVLGFSLITPFRSRLYFALAMIFVTGWGYRHLRRSCIALVIGGSLVACVIMMGDPDGITLITRRALSTILSVNPNDASYIADIYSTSSEVGWESGFRATLTRLAYDRIKEHPLVGNGFSFSSEDLANAASMMGGNSMSGGSMTLVVGGTYHNSLLALSVFCGVPVAVFFALGVILILRLYIRFIRDKESSQDKAFCVALLAFVIVIIGQTLMNGDGMTFLLVCCCLGVMNGMIHSKFNASHEV